MISFFEPDHIPGCCYYDGPNYLETVVEMYANEESLQMLKSFLNNARSAGYYDQVLQVTQPFFDVLNQIKQGINAPIPKSIAIEGKIPGSNYEAPMSIDEAKLLLKSPQSWLSKFVRRQEDIRETKVAQLSLFINLSSDSQKTFGDLNGIQRRAFEKLISNHPKI